MAEQLRRRKTASPLDALREGFTDPVRDVLWGHIYLTPEMAALTGSPPFMRLGRIFQLGPVYGVYPGATHTRASHSVGVYHLGRRLLRNLAGRGADAWIGTEGALSFLCACLLHDLGHFPYTHSLKELPLLSHEELTGRIILSEPVKSLIAAAGADPALSAAIVDKNLPGRGAELLFYRKLLSGALDPDKLDYLNRDARYCGIPYGAQDVDFILSRLYPHRERGVDIDSRGIPSIESILFSKYLMYRTVYWHHSVRSATSMIKKALLLSLETGLIAGEELYNLDDQGLFTLLRGRGSRSGAAGTAAALAEAVREGRLFGTAAEFPFVESDHLRLRDITNRSRYEENLAGELRKAGVPVEPEALIIDVPEPVSFETGLYVNDEGCFFGESSSAFRLETVNSFIKSLYIIRIFVDPAREGAVKSCPALHRILHIDKKWLNL
ncbi:MAG: HD domain-containing protein [Treponema sp.]|jgi:HD superfamily phosphohydrolase|nr:HD domain-containing protein [Treponema sp.]